MDSAGSSVDNKATFLSLQNKLGLPQEAQDALVANALQQWQALRSPPPTNQVAQTKPLSWS